MTYTVRIMPLQPIEAKRDEFGEGYYVERGTSIILRDYLNSGGVGWVEVSDPIVWDGSDEAFKAIREALGHGQGVLEVWLGGDEYEPPIEITSRCTLNRVGLVVHGARIRIEGDSFAILPPEGVQS